MDERLFKPFTESVISMFKEMGGIEIKQDGDFYQDNDEFMSYGVSSIINFIGKIKGRLLLDMEPSVALHLANSLMDEKYTSTREQMVLASVSELNNTIAGDATTKLNNDFNTSMRLAPPIVFTSKDTVISIPKITSMSVNCLSQYGKIKINVAWEGGLD